MSNNSSYIYTPEEIQQYLSQLQHQSTMAFIPALVYLFLLIVVGSVGNSLVLVVYCSKMTRTPLRIYIISMAILDLPTNLLVIPGEIYDMFHVWDFDMPNVCKIRRYLNSAMVLSSGFVLVAIATTRYRMVCSPLGKQVTIAQAKLNCIFIAVFSCVISLPYGIIHGTQTIKTPNQNISGRHCGIDDSYVKTIWPNVNSAFFMLIFLSSCLTMIVFYACIGHKTWKHHQTRKRSFKLAKTSVTMSPVLDKKKAPLRKISGVGGQTTISSETKPELTDMKDESIHAISVPSLSDGRTAVSFQENEISMNDCDITLAGIEFKNSIRIKTSNGRRSLLGRTSWMMITVCLAFVLGFVPFVALNFYKTALPESYAALEGVPLAVYHLFLRSYLVNCAINPIVYSLLDRNFKSTCSRMFNCC